MCLCSFNIFFPPGFAEETNYNMTLKCRTELKEHGKLHCFHMDVNTEQGNNCLHITYSCSMFLTLESDNGDHRFTKLSSLKNIHCRGKRHNSYCRYVNSCYIYYICNICYLYNVIYPVTCIYVIYPGIWNIVPPIY